MGLFIVLFALGVVGIILLFAVPYQSPKLDALSIDLVIFCVCSLLVASFILIGTRADTRSFALALEQTRATIEDARSNEGISEYEIAALQQSIIDCNVRLVNSQYWQKNPWINWFIPAWIQELELLR